MVYSEISFTGITLLIRHVHQPIPIYHMMFVRMTKMTWDVLYRLFRNLLWGYQKGGGSKVPLVAWKFIIQPKDQGRLGFKDLTDHAHALLSKWTKKLLDDPKSKWTQLYSVNLYLMKWKNLRISRHLQFSF